ncbi:tryptophanase leader peptide [Mesocricetibacter intestinalis]
MPAVLSPNQTWVLIDHRLTCFFPIIISC